MRRGLLPVMAGLAAGAAVAFALATGVSRPELRTSRPAPAPVETAVSREELQSLQLQVELLSRAVGALAAEGTPLRPASAPSELLAETPEAPPAAADDDEASDRERLVALEARLGEEGEDGALGAFLSAALREALAAGRAAGASLRDAACSATLCRVEFALAEPAYGNAALLDLTQLVPWDGEGILTVPGDDPRTAILFVAREGAAL